MESELFYELLEDSEKIGQDHVGELGDLVNSYPYFATARKMHLKGLQKANDIHFHSLLQKNLYLSGNLKHLYFYLYPVMKISDAKNHIREEKYSGSYFDMLEKAEGGKNSLRQLAEKLKLARAIVVPEETPLVNEERVDIPVPDYFRFKDESKAALEVTMENYISLYREKKYLQALEILRQLNLNNPKKSVYFADQIRFLEKVIKIQHNS